jgi:hypothetical protein
MSGIVLNYDIKFGITRRVGSIAAGRHHIMQVNGFSKNKKLAFWF